MARPKKEKELKHNHQIMLRLTDTEYEIVAANAKNANLPLAEYARKQIMNKKVIAIAKTIGSNLNQIARYFNSDGIHSQKMRNAISQSIARIYEMKYEVLKTAGNFLTTAE